MKAKNMWKFWNLYKSKKPLPGYLRLIKYLLLTLVGLILAVFLLRGLVHFYIGLPANIEREAEMREKFNNRLPAMQQLEKMQRVDDRLSVMAFDFYRIAPESREEIVRSNLGLSEARWREYRLWLEQAKIKSLRSNPWVKPRILYFWINEFSGYAYLEVPPPKNYSTLTECRNDDNLGTCYVYLSDHWYLYFWSSDRPK